MRTRPAVIVGVVALGQLMASVRPAGDNHVCSFTCSARGCIAHSRKMRAGRPYRGAVSLNPYKPNWPSLSPSIEANCGSARPPGF